MIIWKPNGPLNISQDPSNLPQESDAKGSMIISDAMTRCKNLRVDTQGKLVTRDGSSKLNATAVASAAGHLLVEQGGNRYLFAGNDIYLNETSIASSLSSAEWSAIKYNSFNSATENIFAVNGTNRKRIEGSSVYEWGIAAPTVAPTTAIGALTGLTGAYRAKYSYCRKEGTTVVSESNLSPASNSTTLANQSLSVSFTASSDSQVTHVRVYRTLAGDVTYYHDQDIAIGTTTVDTNTADGSLGDAEATDHDRPPSGTFAIGPNYNGTCFILDGNRLYFCKPKQPEYWPTSYYVEVGPLQDQCVAAAFYSGQLYVLTKYGIYHIQGTAYNTFFPIKMDALLGTLSRKCALSVHGHGLFHLGIDGIYVYAGSDINFTESAFLPLFRNEAKNGIPAVDLSKMSRNWLIQFKGQVYFGYCSSDDDYPTHCLVFHITTKRSAYYTWGVGISAVCVDETNNRLLGFDADGYVRHLENIAANDDAGTAIEYDSQSKNFVLQTRRNFPRWSKYDVSVDAAASCTAEIIVDDAVLQSHNITGNRNTVRRLIATGNGSRSAVRIYGNGPVEIFAAEFE